MNINLIFLVISIFWISCEIILLWMRRSRARQPELDKSSLRILWATIIISIIVGDVARLRGLGLIRTGRVTISLTGLAFILAGLALRWTAIMSLGKYFTADVSIKADHKLVTAGLYKALRHPAYTGSLLSFLGLGMAFSSWVTLIIIFVPILCAFLYRIHVEEKALSEHFGSEYLRYRQTTWKLIPYLF